jgi:hypothetical protein
LSRAAQTGTKHLAEGPRADLLLDLKLFLAQLS